MTKPWKLMEQLLEDEIEDLDRGRINLPPGIQARWRKHDELRKIPHEHERASEHGGFRSKPYRIRRDSH